MFYKKVKSNLVKVLNYINHERNAKYKARVYVLVNVYVCECVSPCF